jgi:hypothetical protein
LPRSPSTSPRANLTTTAARRTTEQRWNMELIPGCFL